VIFLVVNGAKPSCEKGFQGEEIISKVATVGPRTVAVTVLLEYFVTGVCCIRVFQHSSKYNYKSTGFIHPNKFTFLIQLAQRCSDNGGPTVPTCTWLIHVKHFLSLIFPGGRGTLFHTNCGKDVAAGKL